MDKGLGPKRIRFGLNSSFFGSTRTLVFVHELDLASAAAARANQEMRTINPDNLKRGSAGDEILVRLDVMGKGENGVEWVKSKYLKEIPHMGIEIEGRVIQPKSKELMDAGTARHSFDTDFNVTRTDVSIDYSFLIEESDRTKSATVILIDNKGEKESLKVNLANVLAPTYSIKR